MKYKQSIAAGNKMFSLTQICCPEGFIKAVLWKGGWKYPGLGIGLMVVDDFSFPGKKIEMTSFLNHCSQGFLYHSLHISLSIAIECLVSRQIDSLPRSFNQKVNLYIIEFVCEAFCLQATFFFLN